jgi:hypothetical protein
MPPDEQPEESKQLAIEDPDGKEQQNRIKMASNPLEELLPEETPIAVRQAVRTIWMMTMFGPARDGDPLLDKLGEKQIDKYLDNLDRDSQREHDRKKAEPVYRLLYVVIGVLTLDWVIWYLAPTNSALLSDILKILVAAILGFDGGFGYKSYLDQRISNGFVFNLINHKVAIKTLLL